MTGSLATAREGHTATLLPKGKVLIAGGLYKNTEFYDPVRGLWTATGNVGAHRYLHTATLLPNGKVLLAAGRNGAAAIAGAELGARLRR